MLGQVGLTPQEMPTALLADYIVALDKVPGIANAAALRGQAEGVLRSRFVYEGTRVDLSDANNAPWWLMSSGDESAIKALVQRDRPARVAGRDAQADGRRRDAPEPRALGHDHRQRLGCASPRGNSARPIRRAR